MQKLAFNGYNINRIHVKIPEYRNNNMKIPVT